MLASSVAAGVVSTFGAPFGGVLFSIEVTSTYYVVGNLWKAFFCACWCVVAFKLMESMGIMMIYEDTHFDNFKFLSYDMFAYALLGILCGGLGALFVHIFAYIAMLRTKVKYPYISEYIYLYIQIYRRWQYIIGVCLICAISTYPLPFFHQSDKQILNDLFSNTIIEETVGIYIYICVYIYIFIYSYRLLE